MAQRERRVGDRLVERGQVGGVQAWRDVRQHLVERDLTREARERGSPGDDAPSHRGRDEHLPIGARHEAARGPEQGTNGARRSHGGAELDGPLLLLEERYAAGGFGLLRDGRAGGCSTLEHHDLAEWVTPEEALTRTFIYPKISEVLAEVIRWARVLKVIT